MKKELKGLTQKEAKLRLSRFGYNEFKKRQEYSDFNLFLDQFKSPLIYILVFACLVTLFLRDFVDSAVIFIAVFVNTLLGFFQERKAQKALIALQSYLVSKTKVIRNGERKLINTRELVPGDLVVLEIGGRVPGDGVLVEATDLSINEAILTGESMPVRKIAQDTSFMGTTITTGIAKMIVTKTGMETEMGKIGEKVTGLREEKTPLQNQLDKLAKILAVVVGLITVLIFVLGEILGYEPLQMFTTSVAVAVAAIPEGLVVTLTVILSLGMQRILKKKALVRKLLAAETLGSVSTICCDKTGTLTEGKMRVVGLETTNKRQETIELLVKAAILCNDMRDPLEVAMMEFAEGKLKNKEELVKTYSRIDEIPFSPEHKFIATLHATRDTRHATRILFVSGAPEVVLHKCKISNEKLKIWEKKFEDYGKKGYRL
ncbi:HAD-IC family P-type ATPase, partial [Candidatus Microgenomates bacterium]|nr:HAD-IC family P-type ATPase [Candidatus Microgenomates bacterium]